MKRVLCFVGGMNAGGAESFLMKLYRNIDTTKYQMDFCVAISEEGYYDKEIIQRGGRIFHITCKSRKPIKSFIQIKKIVSENHYKSVLRISQNSMSCIDLIAGKCGGASTLAFRSSNSASCGGTVNNIVHALFRPLLSAVANVKIAPSTEAAVFMFGKKAASENRYSRLNNGLDLDVYKFDADCRQKLRDEFKLNGRTVIIHIGRFSEQKNHAFLLDVFNEIHKADSNTVLLLVGTGENECAVREKVLRLGLENSVIFTGVRHDIPGLLSAADCFVFPSFYEGMPNTVIEAQATGLPCVVSDTVTKEADITGLVKYLSLTEPADVWGSAALSLSRGKRQGRAKELRENGYDINDVTKRFTELIFAEKEEN